MASVAKADDHYKHTHRAGGRTERREGRRKTRENREAGLKGQGDGDGQQEWRCRVGHDRGKQGGHKGGRGRE